MKMEMEMEMRKTLLLAENGITKVDPRRKKKMKKKMILFIWKSNIN